MVMKLTTRQAALLAVIQQFLHEKGYPPAQRQLAQLLGRRLRSIQEGLTYLERKGYVAHDPGVSRSLRVLRRPPLHQRALPVHNGDGNLPPRQGSLE